MPGRSAAKPTSRSGFFAIARRQPVTARLNGSVGLSLALGFGLMLEDMAVCDLGSHCRRGEFPPPLTQGYVHRAFRQLHAEAALVELRHHRALELIALVQERQPEG